MVFLDIEFGIDEGAPPCQQGLLDIFSLYGIVEAVQCLLNFVRIVK